MSHPLERLCGKATKRVVGLMSGTSADGIDAALVEVDGAGEATRARLIAFEMIPFSDQDRSRILSLATASTEELSRANFWLGERFADAARKVGDRIDLVGSHGQTVWHAPPSSVPANGTASTLQIGEPSLIAARTKAVTVGNFRVADVALGGEGAPLVPFTDWLLYRKPGRRRALQNIGGIANVTWVTDVREQVIAFDNGPGNMMLDALTPAASSGMDRIDRDGRYSAQGTVQKDLLAKLLADPFLQKPPPKSTGRERYGERATLDWAKSHADRSPADLLATAVAFTAHSIFNSYQSFIPNGVDEVLVSGGGAHNPTLMRHLKDLLAPAEVRIFGDAPGEYSPDAKEAVAFAVLAVQTVHGLPSNLPQVTGARGPAVLGQICLPPY